MALTLNSPVFILDQWSAKRDVGIPGPEGHKTTPTGVPEKLSGHLHSYSLKKTHIITLYES